MASKHADKYPQSLLTQAIKLYGDRAGGKGTFGFAGFAWIQDAKVVLIQGEAESLNTTADWRCFLRLTALAHRLKKPIVLWNLPAVHIATIQSRTSLDSANVIQNAGLELLKLPHPIIAVFDSESDNGYTDLELAWSDGIVLVRPSDAQVSEHDNIKVVHQATDIAPAILELISQVEEIPATELVENRQETLRLAVRSGTELS